MNERKRFHTFPLFLRFFLVYRPEFQGHFLYIDNFSTTAREIGTRIGHELASTYPCVFQLFFRPSDNFHFISGLWLSTTVQFLLWSTAHHNRRLLHHPIVLNPVGAIQNQHARESTPPTKEGKPPRNEDGKWEEKCHDWKSEKPRHWHTYKNRPTHAFTSWHHWGVSRNPLPFLSLPHPELLHSPSTTQNERRTHFFKCSVLD